MCRSITLLLLPLAGLLTRVGGFVLVPRAGVAISAGHGFAKGAKDVLYANEKSEPVDHHEVGNHRAPTCLRAPPPKQPAVASGVDEKHTPATPGHAAVTSTSPTQAYSWLPHKEDEMFFEMVDAAYDEAFRLLEHDERDDERGVRVAWNLPEFDPAYFGHRRHVDWVLEKDGTWTIYLTKMASRAHEIMQPTIARQVEVWSLTAGIPDGLPKVRVYGGSSQQIEVLGQPTKPEPDAGIEVDAVPDGWRIVLEMDVSNTSFLVANRRVFDYIRGWEYTRVGVVFKLWGHREPKGEEKYGDFVGIACVWRIDDQGQPMLDRVFDMGTCNHDYRQEPAKTQFLEWLRTLVAEGRASHNPSINLRRLQDRACTMQALAFARATEPRHCRDARRASQASSALQHPDLRGRAALRLRAPPRPHTAHTDFRSQRIRPSPPCQPLRSGLDHAEGLSHLPSARQQAPPRPLELVMPWRMITFNHQ